MSVANVATRVWRRPSERVAADCINANETLHSSHVTATDRQLPTAAEQSWNVLPL